MSSSAQVIRNRDLEPAWTVKQAKEPGFMRSLITWVGGPEGYINTNPEQCVISRNAAIGLMRMPAGNRQAGVHIHSVAEIYVILKGETESFDGMGNRHRAGPLDCLYIPKGVPHGVRAVGDDDVELIWLHDAIERNGVSAYLDGPGPFPANDEVRLVPFRELLPSWNGEGAKSGGHLRWIVNWVTGRKSKVDYNPGTSIVNDSMAIGLTSILPGNSNNRHSHSHPETYVILSGSAAVSYGDETTFLDRLDAVRFPPGLAHSIRNCGDGQLHVCWVHELP